MIVRTKMIYMMKTIFTMMTTMTMTVKTNPHHSIIGRAESPPSLFEDSSNHV